MKKRSIANDYLWSFIGIGGQSLLQFIILIVLARLIDKSDFGLVGIVTIVIAFVQILSLLGVGPAIVQIKNLSPKHLSTAMTISICIGIFLGLIVYFLSSFISHFFRMRELEELIKVVTVIFPIIGISSVSASYLQRKKNFKLIAKIDLTSYFLGYGIVGVTLAYLGYGAWALIFAQIFQSLVSATLQLINYDFKFSMKIDKSSLKQLLFFGGGFTIARFSNYFANQADYFVVGRFMNASALGLYTIAFKVVSMPANLFGTVVDRVLFSTMASIQDEKDQLEKMYYDAVKLISMIVFPLTAFIIVVAPELIKIVLGPDWNDASIIVQVLAVSLVFRTSYKISDSLARATGNVYRRALFQIIYASMVLSFCYIGTYYGLIGVAVGASFAIFMNYVFMLILSIRILNANATKYARMNFRYFAVFVFTLPILFIVKKVSIYFTGNSSNLSLVVVSTVFIVINVFMFRAKYYDHERKILSNLIGNLVSKKNKL